MKDRQDAFAVDRMPAPSRVGTPHAQFSGWQCLGCVSRIIQPVSVEASIGFGAGLSSLHGRGVGFATLSLLSSRVLASASVPQCDSAEASL
jgi:hypothetical protein